MNIPSLATERLRLVPPDAAAESAYQRFYTDAEASRAYGGPLGPGAAWARLASDIGTWHLLGFGVWVVQRRDGGAVIGTCGFWQGKGWPRELTWWLLPEARGQGVAFEASRAALHHAYRTFGWPTVETVMNDENLPARRLVDRLGGTPVRRLACPDGVERTLYRLPPPA